MTEDDLRFILKEETERAMSVLIGTAMPPDKFAQTMGNSVLDVLKRLDRMAALPSGYRPLDVNVDYDRLAVRPIFRVTIRWM